MDYFSFNFRTYVEQNYKYNAQQWPPSIQLAQLHSLCSKPGIPLQNGPECPCCHQKMKTPYSYWFSKNVYEDFTGLSSGICGYFLILRSFVVITFLLMCLGSVYQLIMLYKFCARKDAKNCYKLLFLQFVDFGTMTSAISDSIIFGILALSMYYLLLLSNIFILYYLLQIKKDCQDLFTHHTLLVSGIEKDKLDEAFIRFELDRNCYHTIELNPIHEEFECRLECKRLFFRVMSRKLFGYDAGDLERDNRRLRNKMERLPQVQYHEVENFIVTFANQSEAHRFEDLARKDKILCEYLKYPKDIRWEYSGEKLTFCQNVFTISFLTLTIVAMIALVFIPLMFDLELDSKNFSSLTLAQILQCYLISFAISFSSIVYTWIVARGSRKLKTNSSFAERIMFHNTLFALVIYIVTPLIFTLVAPVNPGVGNYVVVQQATIVLVTQMIYSIIDPRYYLWSTRKSLLMGNAKQAFQYNQLSLHKQVACVQYPLLNKLLVSMRIFAFAFGFSFVSPYIPLLLFLCSLIVYLSQKRNIYLHYRSVQLDISVILYSFMYTSLATQAIMCCFLSAYLVIEYHLKVWVIALTIVPLVPAWIVKMWMYRNRYRRDLMSESRALEVPISEMSRRAREDSDVVSVVMEEEVGDYQTEYSRFLKRMRQAKLFQKIDQYVEYLRK